MIHIDEYLDSIDALPQKEKNKIKQECIRAMEKGLLVRIPITRYIQGDIEIVSLSVVESCSVADNNGTYSDPAIFL